MSASRKGWRVFKCKCGSRWKIATRDRFSPSLESCPDCNADIFPYDDVPDETLLTDAMGNLISPPAVVRLT